MDTKKEKKDTTEEKEKKEEKKEMELVSSELTAERGRKGV